MHSTTCDFISSITHAAIEVGVLAGDVSDNLDTIRVTFSTMSPFPANAS